MPGLHFRSLLENDVFIAAFANPARTHILKAFLNKVNLKAGMKAKLKVTGRRVSLWRKN